jgi:hypothetical protein
VACGWLRKGQIIILKWGRHGWWQLKLVRALGRGGFGTVFKVLDVDRQRYWALKVQTPFDPIRDRGYTKEEYDADVKGSLQLEAKALQVRGVVGWGDWSYKGCQARRDIMFFLTWHSRNIPGSTVSWSVGKCCSRAACIAPVAYSCTVGACCPVLP